MPSLLCYILTTRDRLRYWAGPGLLPVARLKLPLPWWERRPEAERAARALRAAIQVDLAPLPVRIP